MEAPKLNRQRRGAVQYQGPHQTELPEEKRTPTHAASHPSAVTASYESFPNVEPSLQTPQALGPKKAPFETPSHRPRRHQKQRKAQARKRAVEQQAPTSDPPAVLTSFEPYSTFSTSSQPTQNRPRS